MKLKPDCIRAVLLKVEELLLYSVNENGDIVKSDLSLDNLCDALPEYRKEDVYYSLYNLNQAGYVEISTGYGDGNITICFIDNMTFDGHEFLDGIRDSSNWSAIKKCMTSVRNYSLDAISSIAEGVTSAAINHYLSQL